ncbi:MAG: hypothetical protein ACI9DF_005270, partial [Verrucomicrobiales bacterium]
MISRLLLIVTLLTGTCHIVPVRGEESAHTAPVCFANDRDFFRNEVWGKVAARSCLKCHQSGGDAEDSEFILRDPARDAALGDVLAYNRAAFTKMAMIREEVEGNPFRMLSKVVGELDHGGEDVLQPDSIRYRILEEFVRRANGEPA